MNSGKDALDIEPLGYHCSISVVVPGRAAKGPCTLSVVLYSGSGMSMVKEKRLRRVQKTWQDLKLVFPYDLKFTVAMADERSALLTQQTCLLTASVLPPWALVGIRLGMAVLPGGYYVHMFVSRALQKQLNVDAMEEGLSVKALGSDEVKKNDQVAARR